MFWDFLIDDLPSVYLLDASSVHAVVQLSISWARFLIWNEEWALGPDHLIGWKYNEIDLTWISYRSLAFSVQKSMADQSSQSRKQTFSHLTFQFFVCIYQCAWQLFLCPKWTTGLDWDFFGMGTLAALSIFVKWLAVDPYSPGANFDNTIYLEFQHGQVIQPINYIFLWCNHSSMS